MTNNVGTVDRTVRLILAVGLIAWAMGYLPMTGELPSWSWVGLVVGAILGLTALLGTCPAYSILGVNTCAKRT